MCQIERHDKQGPEEQRELRLEMRAPFPMPKVLKLRKADLNSAEITVANFHALVKADG